MVPFIFKVTKSSHGSTAQAEDSLLSYLFRNPELKSNQPREEYDVFDVQLSNGSSISTLRIPGRGMVMDGTIKKVSKVPLLLLHGFGGGKSTWAPLLGKLAIIAKEQQRVIYAIDLPGMGHSSTFLNPHEKEWTRVVADDGTPAGKRSSRLWYEAR